MFKEFEQTDLEKNTLDDCRDCRRINCRDTLLAGGSSEWSPLRQISDIQLIPLAVSSIRLVCAAGV